VCCVGASSYSTAIKETVFCNFELTYLSCCLHPPEIACDEGGSLEGRVQSVPQATKNIYKKTQYDNFQRRAMFASKDSYFLNNLEFPQYRECDYLFLYEATRTVPHCHYFKLVVS
jgi:hypothetical protein